MSVPRKQVNLDIIEKFTNPDTNELCDPRLFCLNTNSKIIADNGGRNYSSIFLPANTRRVL